MVKEWGSVFQDDLYAFSQRPLSGADSPRPQPGHMGLRSQLRGWGWHFPVLYLITQSQSLFIPGLENLGFVGLMVFP